MNTRLIILAGIALIALLACTGTVAADSSGSAPNPASSSGSNQIGPGSPLYGLEVTMENLDETFTFNDTQRLDKQVSHAQARIGEVQQSLERNQTRYAEQALDQYWQKLNQTESTLSRFPSDGTTLLHAQEIIARNQAVLGDLLSRYPSSSGLARAYNNSQILGQKFGEKTRVKFERVADKNNGTALRAVKLENGKQNNAGGNTSAAAGSSVQEKNETQDRVKERKNDVTATPVITLVQPTPNNTKSSSGNQGKKENK